MRGKLLASVILLLFSFTNTYSQWKPVKTLEGGVSQAIFRDNNILYLLVDNFGIAKSIDSGTIWKRILKTDVSFLGTFSYMSANKNLVTIDTLLSIDTGNTWQTVQIPLVNRSYSFFEVFDGKVYYVGKDSIAISSNNGTVWTKYKLPHNSISWYKNKLFKSNDSLFLVIQNYAIYSTNDSGTTWDSICPTPSISYDPDYFLVKGDTLLYKAAYYLYRSLNRGNSWTQLTCCNLHGVLFENDSLFLTRQDSVFLSTDLGNTINLIAQKDFLMSRNFIKMGNRFIVPSFFWGILHFDINTFQFTQHVKGIYSVPVGDMKNTHDSIFIYSQTPFDGGPSTFYYSYDNGLTWSFSICPEVLTTYRAMAYFDKALYLIKYKNIYKFDLTTLSWSFIGFTQNNICNDLSVDTSGIYCGGAYILKFPLQGGPYSIYSTTPLIWHAAIDASNGTIYGVGATDVLVSPLVSTPLWTTINSGLPGPLNQGIFAFNNSNVYLGGGKGVYRCQPPAYNWSYTGLFDKGLHALDTYGDAVFAATHEKGICVLRNDTSTWDPVNFNLPRGNYDSTHIFAFYALACSDSGVFTGGTRYPDCGLWYRPYNEINIPVSTAVEENDQATSLFSIYPNPANSSLTISFPSSDNQTIKLRIYNTLGKQIYFSKEEITKGKFEKEINVEKLSDGIYFLQLKMKEGSISRKVIINH